MILKLCIFGRVSQFSQILTVAWNLYTECHAQNTRAKQVEILH